MRMEHYMLACYVADFPKKWYKQYGWRNGFTCYVLRYFLVLNAQANLHVTLEEFLALAANAFCFVDVTSYQGQHVTRFNICESHLWHRFNSEISMVQPSRIERWENKAQSEAG